MGNDIEKSNVNDNEEVNDENDDDDEYNDNDDAHVGYPVLVGRKWITKKWVMTKIKMMTIHHSIHSYCKWSCS